MLRGLTNFTGQEAKANPASLTSEAGELARRELQKRQWLDIMSCSFAG